MTVRETDNLKVPGVPVIDYLALTTVNDTRLDLTPLLLSLNIYEDMFSPVMTGNITITDTINLFTDAPIVGNEKLTVKFYSYGYEPADEVDVIHKTFRITKVTDVQQSNDYTKVYTLHFTSDYLI